MSAVKHLTGSATALMACIAISACSTVPANPHYEYSSKYGQQTTETVELAQAPQTAPAAQTPLSSQTRVAPQTMPANSPGATTSTSPTEQAYNADRMVGTPGYEMMRAQQQAETQVQTPQAPQTMPPSGQIQGPREVTYDYAQNVSGAQSASSPAPIVSAPVSGTAVNVPTGQTYIVQPGDTVYSLSRRLCAPIWDITNVNGIGSDFKIAIGQTLFLPNSSC